MGCWRNVGQLWLHRKSSSISRTLASNDFDELKTQTKPHSLERSWIKWNFLHVMRKYSGRAIDRERTKKRHTALCSHSSANFSLRKAHTREHFQEILLKEMENNDLERERWWTTLTVLWVRHSAIVELSYQVSLRLLLELDDSFVKYMEANIETPHVPWYLYQ